ncbi:MAG TPA: NUDIX domain-containing protein [Gemmatimonadales bacterium]|nr:NUDIX domain-containing protein [Gemmatimonadales bacterium]
MIRPSDALALLSGFDPGADQRAARSLERTRTLLEQSRAPFSRSTFDPGHITASGIVLAPERDRVLLVFHRRLQRWLQPGGHVEPDDQDLPGAASREVLEETGIALDPRVPPVLIGVDVHQIPARTDEPPHFHHDMVFRFLAGDDDRIAPEWGRDVQWYAVDRLDDCDPDEALKHSVARALNATA